jgi:hypothetical protein
LDKTTGLKQAKLNPFFFSSLLHLSDFSGT